MNKIRFALAILSVITCSLMADKAFSQTLPVGTPVLEDYYRRMQLLGKADSTLSFTIRPTYLNRSSINTDVYFPDSIRSKIGLTSFAGGAGKFQILPITWQQQINSDHPYGWNDEAMIPAKGYQTMISGGFYLKIGPLSVQLRPEYVYAANLPFNDFTYNRSDVELRSYFKDRNTIDLPERFGNNAYHRAFLGQSNIMLSFGAVSAGLSNESLWWGPGIQNTLILGNNAPSFKHFTINTNYPVKTFLGHFEAQLIGGKLENSDLPASPNTLTSTGVNLYTPKPNYWRYFTGVNINYHPKWVPGLTLGLIRTFDAYGKDVHGFSSYFPFFTPYSKVSTQGTDQGKGDPFPRDQYTSVYGRWLFTKAQAEVYFEYGLNDNSYNLDDFVGAPQHSRAYLFGVRKMIPISGVKDQQILFGVELTQLSQTIDRIVRDSGGWYYHYEVLQGQTNNGQVLGAGTGPGGNLQSVNISWVSGLKNFGIGFDRYEHNVDFYQKALADINGNSRNWVDFAFSLHGEWAYKNLLFDAKLQEIKSLNYQWMLKDYTPGSYYIPHNDVYNFHAELGISYRF